MNAIPRNGIDTFGTTIANVRKTQNHLDWWGIMLIINGWFKRSYCCVQCMQQVTKYEAIKYNVNCHWEYSIITPASLSIYLISLKSHLLISKAWQLGKSQVGQGGVNTSHCAPPLGSTDGSLLVAPRWISKYLTISTYITISTYLP